MSLDVSTKVRERPLTVDVEFYGSHRVGKRDLSWQKIGRGRGIEEKWRKWREGVRAKEGRREEVRLVRKRLAVPFSPFACHRR